VLSPIHILCGICVNSHEVIVVKLPLEKDGQTVGNVHIETRSTDVVLTASCEEILDGIWRAYLTDGRREFLLGVMQPIGDGYFAKKRIFKSEYSRIGMDSDRLFGKLRFDRMLELSELRWVACEVLAKVFSDDALKNAVRRGKGVLVDSVRRPARIAFPLDGECACAPALCLATMMEFSGRQYAVLGVDRDGNPMTFKGGK